MGTLRILLSLAVIVAHMNLPHQYMIGGEVAVKIFFMISGFYMALILSTKYGDTPRGLKKFAINRALRLYPTYIAVLILTVLWYLTCVWMTNGGTPTHPLLVFSKEVPWWQSAWIWVVNLSLFGIDMPSMFHWSKAEGFKFLNQLPFETTGGIVWHGFSVWVRQAWSIGAELWFYLLAPIVVFGSMSRSCLIALFSVFVGVMCYYTKAAAGFFWPALLVYFVAGVLIYKLDAKFLFHKKIPNTRAMRGLLMFSLFVWTLILPFCGVPLPEWLLYIMMGISIPVVFAATKDNAVDNYIGNLSYSTYLNHLLVAGIVAVGGKRFGLPSSLNVPFVILGSVALGILLERLIERPVEKIRVKIFQR